MEDGYKLIEYNIILPLPGCPCTYSPGVFLILIDLIEDYSKLCLILLWVVKLWSLIGFHIG